jgi:hypothetical protein
MDWMPNYEGIKWFLKRVWPLVEQKNNKAELNLEGLTKGTYLIKLSNDYNMLTKKITIQ